jgi:membrane-associated protease RseP (regulator of RpoE activity)
LFLLTVATTTGLGLEHYASFASNFGMRDVLPEARTVDWLTGLGMFWRAYWGQALAYSASVLGILGAHEMGHYLVCRRYDVDATLPFFLPFPSLSGTMGAVIKIREAFPTRAALFDIAIGGPIGGFVVLVPLLFLGMHFSNVIAVPPDMNGYSLGEPLLFRLATWVQFGHIPDGYSVNIHPVVFAAWFGMLATAWNLLPFGQLDGGHLTYATLGDRSRYFSYVTVAGAIVMCFISYSWVMMTVMMLAMLYFIGPRHPRVLAEYEPLGRGRYLLFAFAIVMFILCFTPTPIDPL